jgi:prepilin-type N-terminal cleavage/methylation domain-containing protein
MKQKSGFTLVELLVVIAVIAIVAAILFPVLAQAREKARQITCLSNCKQWGSTFMMYVQDYDETYPLAFGYSRSLGGWMWSASNAFHQVPVGWRNGTPVERLQVAAVEWANSVQPYVKTYSVYACPSGAEVRLSTNYEQPLKPWANVSYTFNGLLMGYPEAGVVTPSRVPLLWEGHGKANIAGFALANPALICQDPDAGCRYIPRSQGACVPGNGGQSTMFGLEGTMWIHNRGAIFVMADGSARWRRLGGVVGGRTDGNTDPYTNYDDSGFPKSAWVDGCHAWLFRPDFQQQ